jgi:protoporphyrinogen oxidase
MSHYPVIIVGGGLSGLTCANYLFDAGKPFLLIEANEKLGGRVKTVVKDGFLLDVGFQVFLNSYEEAKALLDIESLNLGYFKSGANIYFNGKWHQFENPLKNPLALFSTLFSPVGSWKDKIKVLMLTFNTKAFAKALQTEDSKTSTVELLRKKGFSEVLIKRFFQPFFGGVFLDKTLGTPANFFQYLFQQFYQGEAGLPAAGMQAIAAQLAENLPPESLKTGTKVVAIDGKSITLENGEKLTTDHLVVATNYKTAKMLLPTLLWNEQKFNGTINLYYSTPPSFESGKMLRLVAEPGFIINNIAVLDEVSSDYSPNEKHILSITLLEGEDLSEDQLEQRVQEELKVLFGEIATHFHFLHRFEIPDALPAYTGQSMQYIVGDGITLAGDYLQYPSINGAMLSGRLAAENVLKG